jgi:mannose-6-phosphate isomerase
MPHRASVYALDAWLLPPVVWGGFELQRSFGKSAAPDARLGESWEVSCVPGRESTIRGTKTTLSSEFAADAAHFLGTRPAPSGTFPLLVKLLSTSASLSVQVHPSDEQARRLEGVPIGKQEAWVVLAAGPSSEVLAGLRPGATASQLFEAALSGDGGRVRDLLVSHSVVPGDVVVVPPGCVHAPGADLVLYEVQQPVDLTYRIFDWGRAGLDGKPRPLQVEKARQVLNAAARARIKRQPAAQSPTSRREARERIIAAGPFVVERWSVTGSGRYPVSDVLLCTCVDGRGTVSARDDRAALTRGSSCVVPAAAGEVAIEGEGFELLVATRP